MNTLTQNSTEPKKQRTKRRSRNATGRRCYKMVTLRITSAERETLNDLAEAAGISLQAFMYNRMFPDNEEYQPVATMDTDPLPDDIRNH